jgi:hypothetical protein
MTRQDEVKGMEMRHFIDMSRTFRYGPNGPTIVCKIPQRALQVMRRLP